MLLKTDGAGMDKGLLYGAYFYLFIDYLRPQYSIPVLGYFKLGLLAVVFLVWKIIASKKAQYALSKEIYFYISFVLLYIFLFPFSTNNFYAYQTIKTLLLYLPYMLAILIAINSIKRYQNLIDLNIIFMSYLSLYGLSHNGVGPGGNFGDENDLALYINMWLPFTYFLFLYEKTKMKKYFYLISFGIGLITIIVTFSRGGFVGLVCSFFVIWLYSKNKIKSLFIIGLLSLVVTFFADEKYWSDMSTITETKENTADARLKSWKAAWEMFKDNPLGVGANNFPVEFSKYQGEMFQRDMWGRHAHSLWFTLIPEAGIIGIFIFFSLLYMNFRSINTIFKLSKNGNTDELQYFHAISSALLASMVGFFASASFISVLYYAHYWYIIPIIILGRQFTEQSYIQELQLSQEIINNA